MASNAEVLRCSPDWVPRWIAAVGNRAGTPSEREGGMRCREDTAPRPSGSTHGGCLTSLVPIPSLAAVPTIREVVQALSRRSGVDAVLVVGRDGLPIDSHVANGVDGDSVA